MLGGLAAAIVLLGHHVSWWEVIIAVIASVAAVLTFVWTVLLRPIGVFFRRPRFRLVCGNGVNFDCLLMESADLVQSMAEGKPIEAAHAKMLKVCVRRHLRPAKNVSVHIVGKDPNPNEDEPVQLLWRNGEHERTIHSGDCAYALLQVVVITSPGGDDRPITVTPNLEGASMLTIEVRVDGVKRLRRRIDMSNSWPFAALLGTSGCPFIYPLTHLRRGWKEAKWHILGT